MTSSSRFHNLCFVCSYWIPLSRALLQRLYTLGWNMIFFTSVAVTLLAEAAVWCVIFHPVCITPVCLKLALGWTSRGCATLSCNTWFHKWGLNQPHSQGSVWTVMTLNMSPQSIPKCLQGFLCLSWTVRQTCLNTNYVPGRVLRKSWPPVKSDSLGQEWKGWHHVLGAEGTVSTFGSVTPDCESVCSDATLLTQWWRRPLNPA